MRPAPAVSGAGTVLNLSDIHFDPFYGMTLSGAPNAELNTLLGALSANDPSTWDADLAKSTAQSTAYSVYQGHGGHYDTNYKLLKSGLDEAAKVAPSPDFVVITGDFLAHNFQAGFAAYLKANPGATVTPPTKGCVAAIADKNETELFICKTMQYIAMEISQRYPSTPVYAALGNNDSYDGDYEISPGGSYLADMAGVWESWFLPNLSGADKTSFEADFKKGGYYALPLPTTTPGRLIVLSTSMFSGSNIQTGAVPTTAAAQLSWLSGLLASAKGKETLWIAGHIAPGLDGYGGGESWQNSEANPYDSTYAGLVSGAQAEIAVQLFGHTHMQEFKLFGPAGAAPYGYLHIAPGLTPWNGNNSGFQVLTYNTKDLSLADYNTWYVDNKAQGAWGPAPQSFKAAYGNCSATMTVCLQSVYNDLNTGVSATQTTYDDRYDVYVPGASVSGGFSTYCPRMIVDPVAPVVAPPPAQ